MKIKFTHFQGKIGYYFDQYNHNYDYGTFNDLEPHVIAHLQKEMAKQLQDITEFIIQYELVDIDTVKNFCEKHKKI